MFVPIDEPGREGKSGVAIYFSLFSSGVEK
jgi:hypothetical protein